VNRIFLLSSFLYFLFSLFRSVSLTSMNFRDWQQLSPSEAAREIHRRIAASFTPAQHRAVIAALPTEAALAHAFESSDRTAPLAGVPYFLKDLFSVASEPMAAGSTFLPEVRPTSPGDSTLVSLLHAAGAICAGKTQLHEFAYGITGENPHYGDCEHPRFPGRTTGGSSSGSAAIVAAGIVPFAIGTDTGGSIRVPAAFCGLYGFRLTPGDRLIRDAFPLAPSFDTAGWFTANAADMAIAWGTLVGTATGNALPRGIYLEPPGLDPDVASAYRAASLGFAPPADAATRLELLNGFNHNREAYSRIVAAEAWQTHQLWADRNRDRYDPAVWQRLQVGANQPTADLDRARAALAAVRMSWARYFLEFDFLIMPATPFGALLKADCTPTNRNCLLDLTAPASLGGLPVLTVPILLPSGLTTGLQIIAAHPTSSVFPWALGGARTEAF
jgi:aspartyl-tRNA(Asn)/glutamyl-tRNA(Gln) amidotransferase subunit A